MYAEKNKSLLKALFDYAKSSGPHGQYDHLPDELIVDQMDEEQIWQQLEMQNESFWNKCMTETCRLLSLDKSKLAVNINFAGENTHGATERKNVNSHQNGSNIEPTGKIMGNIEDDEEEEDEEDEEDDENDENDEDGDEEEEEDGGSDDGDGVLETETNVTKTKGSSCVDDQFFKLSEMEAFLDSEDKRELDRLNGKIGKKNDEESDEEEIDYFDSLSDNDESDDESGKGKDAMFTDFFDGDDQENETPEQIRQRRRSEREAKNKRKEQEMKEDLGLEDSEADSSESEGNLFENDDDDEEDDDVDENEDRIVGSGDDDEDEESDHEKSEFDLRQQRLKNRIEDLEEKALADKPWQLKGEITSSTRPKNSLLEEVLDFDSVARPPPLITEETTMCLEEIIKKRIKSKAWDDVERKIKPITDREDFRKNLVLQQEKSKESLSQIYEKDYLEKVHKLNNVEDTTKQDEPKEHTDIRKAMKDLFIKLDALSNFHFTSKPVAAEAKIITNIPAIEMEEVAPVAVSDATLLAPEEIRPRSVGDEIGKTERTKSDKKRERRKKKVHQKLKKIQNDKRVEEKEKLGIKVTSKEKQQQLMNQVTKNRNVIKVLN